MKWISLSWCLFVLVFLTKTRNLAVRAEDCQGLVVFSGSNGRLSTQNVTEGTVVTIICNPGYSTDSPTLTCVEGRWNGLQHPVIVFCEPDHCDPLPKPDNAKFVGGEPRQEAGTIAVAKCNEGYNLTSGNLVRHCMADPDELNQVKWNGTAAECSLVHCNSLTVPDNGFKDKNETQYNTVVVFSCDEGYSLVGSAMLQCLASGKWNETIPHCDINKCPNVSDPTEGYVSENGTSYGDVITFGCKEGFRLTRGGRQLECLSNGTWNGSVPVCDQIRCHTPAIANGTVSSNETHIGSVIHFSCDEGFDLNGSQALQCTSTGLWNATQPQCQIRICSSLNIPPNVRIDTNVTHYTTWVTFSCLDERFDLIGSSVVHCLANQTWTSKEPTCNLTKCYGFKSLANGSISSNETYFGSLATFQCDEGFDLNGSQVLECNPDGIWNDTEPECHVRLCDHLHIPLNGSLSTKAIHYGTVVTFRCDDERFDLIGSPMVQCLANQTWSSDEPVCDLTKCFSLKKPMNGFMSSNETSVGSEIFFGCDEGHYLNGSQIQKCTSSGTWNSTEPTCHIRTCRELETPLNGTKSTEQTLYGTQVNFTCHPGYDLEGADSLSCLLAGEWNGSEPLCNLRLETTTIISTQSIRPAQPSLLPSSHSSIDFTSFSDVLSPSPSSAILGSLLQTETSVGVQMTSSSTLSKSSPEVTSSSELKIRLSTSTSEPSLDLSRSSLFVGESSSVGFGVIPITPAAVQKSSTNKLEQPLSSNTGFSEMTVPLQSTPSLMVDTSKSQAVLLVSSSEAKVDGIQSLSSVQSTQISVPSLFSSDRVFSSRHSPSIETFLTPVIPVSSSEAEIANVKTSTANVASPSKQTLSPSFFVSATVAVQTSMPADMTSFLATPTSKIGISETAMLFSLSSKVSPSERFTTDETSSFKSLPFVENLSTASSAVLTLETSSLPLMVESTGAILTSSVPRPTQPTSSIQGSPTIVLSSQSVPPTVENFMETTAILIDPVTSRLAAFPTVSTELPKSLTTSILATTRSTGKATTTVSLLASQIVPLSSTDESSLSTEQPSSVLLPKVSLTSVIVPSSSDLPGASFSSELRLRETSSTTSVPSVEFATDTISLGLIPVLVTPLSTVPVETLSMPPSETSALLSTSDASVSFLPELSSSSVPLISTSSKLSLVSSTVFIGKSSDIFFTINSVIPSVSSEKASLSTAETVSASPAQTSNSLVSAPVISTFLKFLISTSIVTVTPSSSDLETFSFSSRTMSFQLPTPVMPTIPSPSLTSSSQLPQLTSLFLSEQLTSSPTIRESSSAVPLALSQTSSVALSSFVLVASPSEVSGFLLSSSQIFLLTPSDARTAASFPVETVSPLTPTSAASSVFSAGFSKTTISSIHDAVASSSTFEESTISTSYMVETISQGLFTPSSGIHFVSSSSRISRTSRTATLVSAATPVISQTRTSEEKIISSTVKPSLVSSEPFLSSSIFQVQFSTSAVEQSLFFTSFGISEAGTSTPIQEISTSILPGISQASPSMTQGHSSASAVQPISSGVFESEIRPTRTIILVSKFDSSTVKSAEASTPQFVLSSTKEPIISTTFSSRFLLSNLSTSFSSPVKPTVPLTSLSVSSQIETDLPLALSTTSQLQTITFSSRSSVPFLTAESSVFSVISVSTEVPVRFTSIVPSILGSSFSSFSKISTPTFEGNFSSTLFSDLTSIKPSPTLFPRNQSAQSLGEIDVPSTTLHVTSTVSVASFPSVDFSTIRHFPDSAVSSPSTSSTLLIFSFTSLTEFLASSSVLDSIPFTFSSTSLSLSLASSSVLDPSLTESLALSGVFDSTPFTFSSTSLSLSLASSSVLDSILVIFSSPSLTESLALSSVLDSTPFTSSSTSLSLTSSSVLDSVSSIPFIFSSPSLTESLALSSVLDSTPFTSGSTSLSLASSSLLDSVSSPIPTLHTSSFVASSSEIAKPTPTSQIRFENGTASVPSATATPVLPTNSTVNATTVYNTTASPGFSINTTATTVPVDDSVEPTNDTMPLTVTIDSTSVTDSAPPVNATEQPGVDTSSVSATAFPTSQYVSIKPSATMTAATKYTTEVNATVPTPSSFIVTVSVSAEPTSATVKTTDATTPNATDSLATVNATTSESATITLSPTVLPTNDATVLPTNDTLITINASSGSVKTTVAATSFPTDSMLSTHPIVTANSVFPSIVSTDKVTEPTTTAAVGVTAKPPETTTLQPTRKPTEPFIPSVEYWAQIVFKLNFLSIHLNTLEWRNFMESNIEKAYTEANTLEQPASTQSQAAEQSKKRRRREDDKVIVKIINATTDGVAEGRAVVTFYIKDQREFVLAQRVTQLLKLHDATTINGIIGYEVVSVHPYGYLSTLRPSFTEGVIDDGFPLWAVALVVVLTICVLLLLLLLICYCCWRAKYTDRVTILRSEENKEKLTEEGERPGIELKHYKDLLHEKAPPIEPTASWLGDEDETNKNDEVSDKIIVAPASSESRNSSQYDVKRPLPDISDDVDISETQQNDLFPVIGTPPGEYATLEKGASHPAASAEMAASFARFSHPLASPRRRLPSVPGYRPVSVGRRMEGLDEISAGPTQTSLPSSRSSASASAVLASQNDEEVKDEKIEQLVALEKFQKKEEEKQKESEAFNEDQIQHIEATIRHKTDGERWRNKQRHRERHRKMEKERKRKEEREWRKSREENIAEKQTRAEKETKLAQKQLSQILDPEATQFEDETKKRMLPKRPSKSSKFRRWKSTASVHPQLQSQPQPPSHRRVTPPAWQWQESPSPSPRVLEVQPVTDRFLHSHPELMTEEPRHQQTPHPSLPHRRRELPAVPATRPPARSTMSWPKSPPMVQSMPMLVQERAGSRPQSGVPPAVVQPSEMYIASVLTGMEQSVQVTPVHRSVDSQGNAAWNPYDNYRQSLDRLYSPSTYEVAQPASAGSLPATLPSPLQPQTLPIQLGPRDAHVAVPREMAWMQQPLAEAIKDELQRLKAAQQSHSKLH